MRSIIVFLMLISVPFAKAVNRECIESFSRVDFNDKAKIIETEKQVFIQYGQTEKVLLQDLPKTEIEKFLKNINFKNKDLTGLDIEGLNISGLNFEGAILNYANLSRVDAKGAKFAKAQFNYTNLDGAILEGVSARYANFDNAILNNSNMSLMNGSYAKFRNAEMDNAIMKNGIFLKSVFILANMNDTNAIEANFTNADMRFITAKDTTFDQANMSHVNGRHGDFENSKFKNTNVDDAVFKFANLKDTELNALALSIAGIKQDFLAIKNLRRKVISYGIMGVVVFCLYQEMTEGDSEELCSFVLPGSKDAESAEGDQSTEAVEPTTP